MRLRAKVLLTTLAVMALGYAVVTLAFIAQIMANARVENAAGVKFTARERFELRVASAGMPSSTEGRERLAALIQSSGILGRWAVVGPEEKIVLAEPAELVGRKHSERSAELLSTAKDVGGNEYRLYAYPTMADPHLARHMAALIPAMLLATLLLGGVLWLLISRQVLSPIVELAEASRLMASGSTDARAGGEHRKDEIGELVRAFNQMAAEVAVKRKHLQQRVDEETEKARRAQEAAAIAQRLAATGKLAAGVAHEINNPLGGMMNAAQRLEASIPEGDERGRTYLGLIREGLDRVARITKQMLRFQRPAAADTTMPIDIPEAVGSALRFAEHRLKGVEIRRELGERVPPVLGARQELEQVFLNLLLNAADAVKDSTEKKLSVRTFAADEGRRVVVEIEDSGCGMTAEECQAAFDIFHTTKSDGSGLGLPVAHSIVTSHGGELLLESARGKGTKAIVRLPATTGGRRSHN